MTPREDSHVTRTETRPRPPQAHDQDEWNGWREQQSRARLPDRRFAETVAGLVIEPPGRLPPQ